MGEAEIEEMPREASQAIELLFEHLDAVNEQLESVETQIKDWHSANELSQRLASVPGIGPLTASALVGAIGAGTQFASARRLAAWLGLTPRVTASGGKQHIGRISRGGDRYLRTLLIHGARAVIGALSRWVASLASRRPVNVAATALAHKNARIVWALITRGESYRPERMGAST